MRKSLIGLTVFLLVLSLALGAIIIRQDTRIATLEKAQRQQQEAPPKRTVSGPKFPPNQGLFGSSLESLEQLRLRDRLEQVEREQEQERNRRMWESLRNPRGGLFP